jgi:hypothetical protein
LDPKYSKKIFAMLLERAKGDRSWRQFAFDCDISYVQMRKLAQGTQENPPRPKLIRKIAGNSFNDIDLEDFMFAAGMTKSEGSLVVREPSSKQDDIYSAYRSLSARDKTLAADFLTFLSERSEKKQNGDKD